jgi:hypothetical protein
MIDEYSSLGITLTPVQILHQLVSRGVLKNTPADYKSLLKVLPNDMTAQ